MYPFISISTFVKAGQLFPPRCPAMVSLRSEVRSGSAEMAWPLSTAAIPSAGGPRTQWRICVFSSAPTAAQKPSNNQGHVVKALVVTVLTSRVIRIRRQMCSTWGMYICIRITVQNGKKRPSSPHVCETWSNLMKTCRIPIEFRVWDRWDRTVAELEPRLSNLPTRLLQMATWHPWL